MHVNMTLNIFQLLVVENFDKYKPVYRKLVKQPILYLALMSLNNSYFFQFTYPEQVSTRLYFANHKNHRKKYSMWSYTSFDRSFHLLHNLFHYLLKEYNYYKGFQSIVFLDYYFIGQTFLNLKFWFQLILILMK